MRRSDLHGYQRTAVEFVTSRDSSTLWLGLGLGKTAVTLTALSDWLDAGVASRVLVIAPLRVARTVWAQEAASWEHTAHLRIALALGDARFRRAAVDADAAITTINRENVPWLVRTLREAGRPWPWDTVVVDESSGFKSWRSQRWRALRSVSARVRRMVLLTGTPAGAGLMDLWSQQWLVDRGAALGGRVGQYRDRWFSADRMGWEWTPREGAEAEIHEAMRPTTLSMAAADWLDMPERVDVDMRVDLPPAAVRAYRQFRQDAVAELPGGTVEASSASVLANKLLQYAQGAVYVNGGQEWSQVHDAKLDALAEIVEDNPSEPLLVAHRYRSDLERLRARFPRAETIDAPDAIDRWNDGGIPMLLVHPQSAGHGLNLQRGGSILVWFGLDWSLELTRQTEGRLHRQGQTRTVRVIRLLARGTLDERVAAILANRDRTQEALLSAVRAEVA